MQSLSQQHAGFQQEPIPQLYIKIYECEKGPDERRGEQHLKNGKLMS